MPGQVARIYYEEFLTGRSSMSREKLFILFLKKQIQRYQVFSQIAIERTHRAKIISRDFVWYET